MARRADSALAFESSLPSLLSLSPLSLRAHRTLHHPLLYGRIHKVHHAYRRSIGLASEYAHPVEFVCANMVPFSAGPLLLGAHYWTIGMWTLLRIGETVDGHCGYEWPWRSVTTGRARQRERRHAFDHRLVRFVVLISDLLSSRWAGFRVHRGALIACCRSPVRRRRTTSTTRTMSATSDRSSPGGTPRAGPIGHFASTRRRYCKRR